MVGMESTGRDIPTHAFKRFLVSTGLCSVADGITLIAWVWLASSLTRDPILVALVPAALKWPLFLLALPSGIFADRYDRLKIIRWADGIRTFILAGLIITTARVKTPAAPPLEGVSNPGLYLALVVGALLVGAAEVFRSTAARSILPQLVEDVRLEDANGKLSGAELVGHTMLGPALGAFLINAHIVLPFAFNALAYGFATANTCRVSAAGSVRDGQAVWRAELRDAWQFFRSRSNLMHLAAISAFWAFFIEMMLVALVLHARENLGASAETYGLIIAGSAVGGVIGAIRGPALVRRYGATWLARLAIAFSALFILLCALAGVATWLTISLAALQFCFLIWNIVSIALRQRIIPVHLLGRVNSIYNALGWLLVPFGGLFAGVISAWAEQHVPRETALVLPFVVASLGCFGIATGYWLRLRRIFARAAPKGGP